MVETAVRRVRGVRRAAQAARAARAARAAQWSPWRVLGLLALATVGDVAFDPLHRHVPLCPFHAVTGWDCPLCGGLRAVDHLAHGHLAAAAHANLLVLVGLPLVALWWLDWALRARRGRPARGPGRTGTVALVAVAVLFTFVRNLPGFAALRP